MSRESELEEQVRKLKSLLTRAVELIEGTETRIGLLDVADTYNKRHEEAGPLLNDIRSTLAVTEKEEA